MKENDGINGNKEISFNISKKRGSFDITVIMDIYRYITLPIDKTS
jgi:hypothetical protein